MNNEETSPSTIGTKGPTAQSMAQPATQEAPEPVLDHTYRIRMLEESSELTKKIGKLEAFIETNNYTLIPWTDRHLLQHQLRAMQSYSRILQQRIKQTTP